MCRDRWMRAREMETEETTKARKARLIGEVRVSGKIWPQTVEFIVALLSLCSQQAIHTFLWVCYLFRVNMQYFK